MILSTDGTRIFCIISTCVCDKLPRADAGGCSDTFLLQHIGHGRFRRLLLQHIGHGRFKLGFR